MIDEEKPTCLKLTARARPMMLLSRQGPSVQRHLDLKQTKLGLP